MVRLIMFLAFSHYTPYLSHELNTALNQLQFL